MCGGVHPLPSVIIPIFFFTIRTSTRSFSLTLAAGRRTSLVLLVRIIMKVRIAFILSHRRRVSLSWRVGDVIVATNTSAGILQPELRGLRKSEIQGSQEIGRAGL